MGSILRKFITLLSVGLLTVSASVISISFENNLAFAAGTASIDDSGVVVPGGVNDKELIVNFTGTSSGPSIGFTRFNVTIKKVDPNETSLTLTNTYQKIGSTDIEVKGVASGVAKFRVFSDGVMSLGAVPTSISFKFPPGSLDFSLSSPWTATLVDGVYDDTNPTIIQTINLIAINKIAQAPLSLTAASQSGTFGSNRSLATSGGSGGGAVSYSAITGTSSGCSVSSNVLTSTSAGTCLVTATKAGNDTYLPISSAQTTVTFAKASRTLSFAATTLTIAYLNTATVLATPSAGDGAVVYASSDTSVCSVDSSTRVVTALQSSGNCQVSATVAEGTNHLAASTTASVVVTAATRPLTVTASSPSVSFGNPITMTALASQSSGLAGNDEVSGATFIYEGTGATIYAPSSEIPVNAGTYSVTPSAATFSSGSAANYSITYVPGIITIAKVSRTVAFSGSTSETLAFGEKLPLAATASTGNGAVTYSTISEGCSVDASSGEVTAAGSSGTCTITASVAEGTNHLTATTSTPFTVTLAKRLLTLAASNVEVTFGEDINLEIELASGTLAGSDLISGVTFTYEGVEPTVYASSTEAPTAPGTYSVTPSDAVFANGDVLNYLVSYSVGTLTIAAAASSTSGGVAVVPPAPETVRQIVQLEKLNFTGGALPKKARRDIRAMVRGMDQVTEVVCTAFAGGPGRKPLTRPMARQLATKACALVQRLEPSAIVKIRVRVAGNDETKLRGLRVAQTGR